MPARAPTPAAETTETRADHASALALANRLRPILVRIARQLRQEIHPLGVTSGQASLLAVIQAHPGIGIAELAAREQTSAPTMSAHIDRLAAAGLVERVRSQAEGCDRRRVGVRVTAEGERVLRQVRTRRTAWLAKRLEALRPEERAAIEAAVDALERLTEVEQP